MVKVIEITTSRLKLRQWIQGDFADFVQLNTDPEVMQFYPDTLNVEESIAMASSFAAIISKQGWGFWAVELLDKKEFIGFVGLNEPAYDLPVTPCVEIGWRLARKFWGNGFATEAANASLAYAFNTLQLPQVYSFTSKVNKRSQAVMQRLGMINTNTNFDHPLVADNDLLREHVLYKIDRNDW